MIGFVVAFMLVLVGLLLLGFVGWCWWLCCCFECVITVCFSLLWCCCKLLIVLGVSCLLLFGFVVLLAIALWFG